MRLEADCVRDVLLCIENKPFNEVYSLDELSEKLPNYSREQLWYTCIQLKDAEFINAITIHMLRSYVDQIKSIVDLTYDGHEFLETIREDGVWTKTKEAAKKVGSYSLHTIFDIAKNLIAANVVSMFN